MRLTIITNMENRVNNKHLLVTQDTFDVFIWRLLSST